MWNIAAVNTSKKILCSPRPSIHLHSSLLLKRTVLKKLKTTIIILKRYSFYKTFIHVTVGKPLPQNLSEFTAVPLTYEGLGITTKSVVQLEPTKLSAVVPTVPCPVAVTVSPDTVNE